MSRFSKLVMIFVDLMQHSLQNIKLVKQKKKCSFNAKSRLTAKAKFSFDRSELFRSEFLKIFKNFSPST